MPIKIDLNGLRKSLGLKQAEFAEKIGIKQAYLSELETGKKPIPTNIYNSLVDVFGEETCDTFAISQEEAISGQHFHGPITGTNPQFAGHDFTNNSPCNFGIEVERVIAAMTAQADLTKEAHEITRRAQAQVDRAQAQVDVAQQQVNRLLSIIEQKLNIVMA